VALSHVCSNEARCLLKAGYMFPVLYCLVLSLDWAASLVGLLNGGMHNLRESEQCTMPLGAHWAHGWPL
jgi:hypothetical protein